MTDTGERKYTIVKMCEWLGVSTSGYYEWRDRPDSATAQRRAYLASLVGEICTPELVVASCVSWVSCPASHDRGGTA